MDTIYLYLALYDAERELGNHEQALGLVEASWDSRPGAGDYERRADCLIALNRRDEAIQWLLAGLVSDWGGQIRDRLRSLGHDPS